MKSLHLLLLLLVVATIDASKANDQTKKVGKRFFKYLYSGLQRWTFNGMTDEDVEYARNVSAQVVANHIQKQSSNLNTDYEESVRILESLMSNGFQGGICGELDMGYYQMAQYWKRQREFYTNNDGENITWRLINTNQPRTYNTFMVSFKTHHNIGYSATPTFIVQMELLGNNPYSNYSIIGIKEVGACTEKGTVQMDQTDIHLSLQQFTDSQLFTKDKMIQFVERLFGENPGDPQISRRWTHMAAPDESFEGSVCHGDKQETYRREELEEWWKKFMIMYHRDTNDPKNTQVQAIGLEPERFILRATMKVQLGTKLDTSIRPIETFDFKIQVSKNTGDTLWFINKFEVMCAPIPKTKEEMQKSHANAYREIIGQRIQQMMDVPEMWYTATGALKDLLNPMHTEFESCVKQNPEEMETTLILDELQHKFWIENKATVGKMEGFDAEDASSMTYVGDKMAVDMWIIWTPLSDNEVHESEWKFKLEWDERLQFFHVIKIIFGCPKTGKGNKSFSSLRDHLGG